MISSVLRRPSAAHLPWGALALWTAATLLLIGLRPLLPTDEVRALSVAWEMHLDGAWLLPHLNGAPYPEKPPLLAWLVNGSWGLFGVSDLAARLVTPAVGLLALLLTWALSRRLFPGREERVHRAAPLILVSLPLWLWWGSLCLYDVPLATAALGAHVAALSFALGGSYRWMVVGGLALGAGTLLKGPVVLVHVLPAWLAWAWWRPQPGMGARRWWSGVAVAVAIGTATGGSWALAASALGGEAYASRLLFTATGARLGPNAAHAQPWWWYLPLLPVVLLPWVFRPGAWTALLRQPAAQARSGRLHGARYLAAWAAGSLLVLSVAVGKQPHYLMPVLPALAVAFAAGLPVGSPRRRGDAWAVAFAFFSIAGVMLAVPAVCDSCVPASALAAPGPWWALVPLAAASVFALDGLKGAETWPTVAPATVAVLLALTAWARPVLELERTDGVASAVHAAQEAGREVAQLRHYKGEFQFTGRLTDPIRSFAEPADLAEWARAHPDGYVLVTRQPGAAAGGAQPVFTTPYRGGVTALWPVNLAFQEGIVARAPSMASAAAARASH